MKSLLKNSGRLAKAGVAIPGPGRYRGLLSDVLVKLKGARADDDTQDMLLDALIDNGDAETLVLGHQNFLGAPHRALEHGHLYHLAERNTVWLRNLFPSHEVSFFVGMRNPASLVPALLGKMSVTDRDKAMSELDPNALFWSDTIHSIREVNTDTPITVWCNEDTPYVWPQIMHEITGLDATHRLRGAFDILRPIMDSDGFGRMLSYLQSRDIPTEAQRRRVIAAFLEKYAIEDQVEEEIDLPGWSAELVEELTAAYDDDMNEISRIPGVTLVMT